MLIGLAYFDFISYTNDIRRFQVLKPHERERHPWRCDCGVALYVAFETPNRKFLRWRLASSSETPSLRWFRLLLYYFKGLIVRQVYGRRNSMPVDEGKKG